MSRVLVTGASGFVGRTLCGALAQAGYRVRAAVRDPMRAPPEAAETVTVGELGANTRWQEALEGVDLAIHLAARAHVMNDRDNDEVYREANARGTQNFAAHCAAAGVRRLVFLSSVKVNGEAAVGRSRRSMTRDPKIRMACQNTKVKDSRCKWGSKAGWKWRSCARR